MNCPKGYYEKNASKIKQRSERIETIMKEQERRKEEIRKREK